MGGREIRLTQIKMTLTDQSFPELKKKGCNLLSSARLGKAWGNVHSNVQYLEAIRHFEAAITLSIEGKIDKREVEKVQILLDKATREQKDLIENKWGKLLENLKPA